MSVRSCGRPACRFVSIKVGTDTNRTEIELSSDFTNASVGIDCGAAGHEVAHAACVERFCGCLETR